MFDETTQEPDVESPTEPQQPAAPGEGETGTPAPDTSPPEEQQDDQEDGQEDVGQPDE